MHPGLLNPSFIDKRYNFVLLQAFPWMVRGTERLWRREFVSTVLYYESYLHYIELGNIRCEFFQKCEGLYSNSPKTDRFLNFLTENLDANNK